MQPRSTAARTAWQTQIDAVLWTVRKINHFRALVVYQNLSLCVINTIVPKVQASTLGFESRQQSRALCHGVPGASVCFMGVSDVHGGGPSALLAGFLAGKGKFALFCRMRRLSSSFSKFVLGPGGGGGDGIETRPGEHCLLAGQPRAVGVYVRARSATQVRSQANDGRWQSLHCWNPKPLFWSKGNNILGSTFPERRLDKHGDLRSLSQGEKQKLLWRWNVRLGDNLLNNCVSVATFASQTLPTHSMHVKETQCKLPQAKKTLR